MALVDMASVGAADLSAGTQWNEGTDNTPTAAIAARLLDLLPEGANDSLIHVEADERAAAEIGEALAGFVQADRAEVVLLPPWDCLPYDRVWPSRESMGRRMMALRALAQPQERPRILVVSLEAALQRVPSATVIAEHFMLIAVGQNLDRDAIKEFAVRTGYILDDRVDEPGEIAFLRDVIDVFPAGDAQPVRIVGNSDGMVTELRLYDPLSQRTEQKLESVLIGPASEWVLRPDAEAVPDSPAQRGPTMEERLLAQGEDDLVTIFEYLPDAAISWSDNADDHMDDQQQLIAEASASSSGGKKAANKFYLSR
jgi:transcription-repair coupling factor (superfamily II helicase)